MADNLMKPAEDLALLFAALVAREREVENQLTKVRLEKEDALRRLLAFKPVNDPIGSGDGGMKERVFDLLESEPKRVFETGEVAMRLTIAPNVASAYLSDLYNNDRVIGRVAKGRYQSLQYAPDGAKKIISGTDSIFDNRN